MFAPLVKSSSAGYGPSRCTANDCFLARSDILLTRKSRPTFPPSSNLDKATKLPTLGLPHAQFGGGRAA